MWHLLANKNHFIEKYKSIILEYSKLLCSKILNYAKLQIQNYEMSQIPNSEMLSSEEFWIVPNPEIWYVPNPELCKFSDSDFWNDPKSEMLPTEEFWIIPNQEIRPLQGYKTFILYSTQLSMNF